MFKRWGLVILALLLNCLPTSISNPNYYFTHHHQLVRIEIDTRFSDYEHEEIAKALEHLSTLNLRFIEVNDSPNLSIKFWRNPDIHSAIIGLHRYDQNVIYIDSMRATTENQLRSLVLHETGHWLGMRHVCLDGSSTKYDCSTIGYGVGIMNPVILTTHVQDFTDLDIREFRRTVFCR